MFYMPNTLDHMRIGIVVSKKMVRHAVARNYIKRVIRELFRLNCQSLHAVDMVVRINLQFGRHEYHLVEQEFIQMLSKLPQGRTQKVAVQ
jgi:ribonuclease P protein component